MTWDILNSIGRLILTLVVVVKITRFRDTMNCAERAGLGIAGSGSFLTIALIWERDGSPFEGWATTLLTVGVIMFLWGRMLRDWKHDQRNMQAVAEARRWHEERGRR